MPKNVIEAGEVDRFEPEPVLSRLLSLHALAVRGDGLHPKLLARAERAATGTFAGSNKEAEPEKFHACKSHRKP